MLVIRCTKEMSRSVGALVTDPPASATSLGDWFAKPVVMGRTSYVLLVSRLSLLPLVLPDCSTVAQDFAAALEQLLFAIDVEPARVAREVAECDDVVFSATDSATVVASLNDLGSRMKRYLPEMRLNDPAEISLWLGSVPLKALGFAFPREVAHKLLG